MTPRNTVFTPERSILASVKLCGPFAAFAAILVVAVGTFEPRDASAYVLEGPKWPSGSTPVMQLGLGTPGRTLLDGNTSWNTAAAPALDMWNQVIDRTQFGRVMNSSAAVSSGDRVNSMAFASTNFGHSFGSNTLAITTFWSSGSTMIEADILFNNAQPWDSYRGSLRSSYDIQRVALHELGHALGLDHSSVASAIMYPYISSSYTLSSDDIAGAQALYGAPTGSPTPTPSPTATATPTATPTGTATPTPTAAPAVMLSPAPGSTFTSSSVTFTWSAGSATSYILLVGSSLNGGDIYNSGATTAHAATVNTVSTDGRTIYVSLYSKVNSSWLANKYTYHAFTASATPTPTPTSTATPSPTATPSSSPAVTVSAAPTSIRSGASATFTISASAPASTATTVRYSMSGNATLGTNYSLSGTPGQVTIQAGASSASVTLTVLQIGLTGKTATMNLTSGTGYTLSPPTSASVFMKR